MVKVIKCMFDLLYYSRLQMNSIMNVSRSIDNSTMSMVNQSISTKECLDLSGKMLDRFFVADDSFPTLVDKMQITKSSQC